MEYKILVKKIDNAFVRNVDKASKELSRQVGEHLSAGWELAGGVSTGVAGTTPYLFQAVVKR
jgi:hypothetical protein